MEISSKAQERQALQQIATIIQGIGGADSYIGMAMKGILEIAASNIDNDAGESPVASAAHSEKKLQACASKLGQAESTLEELRIELKYVTSGRDRALCSVAHLLSDIKTLETETKNAYLSESNALEKLEALDIITQENVCLKAKLYDFMAKEESQI